MLEDLEDEDELISLRGSDDEEPGYEEWNDRMNMENVELSVGFKFPTRKKYREVLRDWSVIKGWDLKFIKNEKYKITATCKNGCDWRIYASSVMKTTTFQIKSIKGVHTCAHRTENRQANYKYLKKRIENIIKGNPNEGLISLKNKIRRDVQIECSMHKVYMAKRYALERIKDNIKQQYERLYDYCATVEKHNPRSTLVLKVDRSLSPPLLQRMYYCLSGLRAGFLDGCRPIIGFDGCFLKGMYKGQLLAAVGRDGSDNIFPIAMAYVEIEKYDSWEWFLNLLLRDLGSHEERGWAFVSDRQKVGYPCCHAISAISYHRLDLEEYVDDYLKKEAYLRVYKHMINPIPSMHDFEVSTLGTVDPPHVATKTPIDKPSHTETGNEPHPTEDRMSHIPQRQGMSHPTETDEISQFSKDIAYEIWFSQPVHSEVPKDSVSIPAPVQIKRKRKQHHPVSMASKLQKKSDGSSSSANFQRTCCSSIRPTLQSQLRIISGSYKPRPNTGSSSSKAQDKGHKG
ncbi:UNVERIFIED_CONTAM: hypothetical protein Sradi_3166000 [Sesamum radiatum]|uniref:Transposase MuDR plant domain-containing protein n=1 Tax=Sesamum radiatum TaxID=300843 RepID=A0AAW2REK0_SESRA